MCLLATSWHNTCVINLLAPPGAFLLQLDKTISSSGELALFVVYLEVSRKQQSFQDGQLADNCYSGISLSHSTFFFPEEFSWHSSSVIDEFVIASFINGPNFLSVHGSNNWSRSLLYASSILTLFFLFSKYSKNLFLVSNCQFYFFSIHIVPYGLWLIWKSIIFIQLVISIQLSLVSCPLGCSSVILEFIPTLYLANYCF